MIEKFDELVKLLVEYLKNKTEDSSVEDLENKIHEKLGVSFQEMKEALSSSVKQNADELATEFVNIAPLGDYSKLLEDNESMAQFLKVEAHKVEHWKLTAFSQTDKDKKMITFNFANKAADDGETFQGFVYVTFDGKIKHAFAQGE